MVHVPLQSANALLIILVHLFFYQNATASKAIKKNRSKRFEEKEVSTRHESIEEEGTDIRQRAVPGTEDNVGTKNTTESVSPW